MTILSKCTGALKEEETRFFTLEGSEFQNCL